MSSPEFSVVVPTRGDSAHLRAALRSALSSGESLEILVVHDRAAGGAAPPAALATPPGRVLDSPGGGPSACRNAGIDAARGRYIALLDDDDVWLPQHLSRSRMLLERQPRARWAAGNAYLFPDPTGGGSAEIPEDPTRLATFARRTETGCLSPRELLLSNPILTPTVVLRREALEPHDRFREELSVMEDYDLWLRLAERHPWAFDAEPTVVVRKRSASASRDRRRMAENALGVLGGPLAAAASAGTVSESERRARMGRLWHDLAYACLQDGDARAARRAALCSARLLPLRLKTYMYLLAGLLPLRARRLFVAADGVR